MTFLSDLHLFNDPLTIVLLGSLILLTVLPGVVLVVWRVSRPPFRVGSFRWLYLAWACLLVASLVWNLSQQARSSVDEAGADNFVRLAFLLLGVLIILFLGARYQFLFIKEVAAGVLGIFFVFGMWGLVSTLWSVSPVGTLYKSSEYYGMLMLFAVAASMITAAFRDPRERLLALKSVFDWNWFLFFLLMVNVYVGILVFPEYAVVQGWRDQIGVLGFSIQSALPGISENGVGQLGAILGIVALVRIVLVPRSRIVFVPVLVLSLVTMVFTQSRSPILAFLIASVVVLAVSRRFGFMALCGGLSTLLLAQYGHIVYEFLRRGQSAQEISSLTGRVSYWEVSLQALREAWLNGYGAYAGGRYVIETALGVEGVATVHSVYLEALLDTGVVGLAIILAALGATWFWLLRVRPYVAGNVVGRLLWLESLGVMTVLSVRSVFSASTFIWSFFVLTFGVILIFVTVTRRQIVRQRYAGAPFAQPVPATRRRRPGIPR